MTKKPDDLLRLLAEEPFVRALAQSLVADEADDVVQQAWLRALEHHPGTLVAAVDALPGDQRTVVLLRYYDGLTPRRIVDAGGVPVGASEGPPLRIVVR
jgi:DNA-directed RNA polymerase specialized sigma24 family protein